jgi:hypothetical protein
VNEQPHSYWIAKFGQLGYTYLEEKSTIRRRQLLEESVAGFYATNLMLFKSEHPELDLQRTH